MRKLTSVEYLEVVHRMAKDAEEVDGLRQRIAKLTALKDQALATADRQAELLKSQGKALEQLRDELGAQRTARRKDGTALKAIRA